MSHDDQLFNKLKLLKVLKITEFELLKAYHKHYRKSFPLSMREMFFKSLDKPKHRYPTRNRNIPNIPKNSSMLLTTAFYASL